MRKETFASESDDEVILGLETQRDEHEGHRWKPTETLYDNPVEHTAWGYCNDCRVEFRIESISIEWAPWM